MSTSVDDFMATAVAATEHATLPTVEPKRDRYGRYLLPAPGEEKPVAHTRATTLARTTADTFNLDQWGRRMLLQGASKRPDLVALAASLDPEQDKKRLNELADQAQEAAAAGAGANYGTAMHAFTAQVDAGLKVSPPPPLDRDIEAYSRTLAGLGITTVPGMIERVVSLPSMGVAGTLDRMNLVALDGWDLPVIGDVKTAKSIWGFGEIALQLALYANAEWLHDLAAGTCEPMPAVDRKRGLVFHLPVGRADCTVYVVDLEAGWEAVQLALDVRAWRARKDLGLPLAAWKVQNAATEVAASAPTTDDNLLAQLEQSLAATQTAGSGDAPSGDAGVDLLRGPVPSEQVVTPSPEPADPEIVAWLRDCVQHVVTELAGRPLPAPWPTGVPTFKHGGPTTVGECATVEAWYRQIGKAAQLSFGPSRPEAPRPLPADLAAPSGPAAPLPAPATTAPDAFEALKVRFQAVRANDLREAATAEARELGVADVQRLDAERVALLTDVVGRMEAAWELRKVFVLSLVQGWTDPELQLLVDLAAPPEHSETGGSTMHWELDQLEVDHVETLEVVMDLVGSDGVVSFAYDQPDPRLVTHADKALDRLLGIFGGKQAALVAAREAAKATGAPGPRSVTDVAENPGLLVATLRRGPSA